MNKIVVLGAGITGLTFAKVYGKGAVVYEKENQLGGKCRTTKIDSRVGTFTFDIGGHWLHLQGFPEAEKFFSNLKTHKRNAYVKFLDILVDFPIQQNFYQIEDKKLVRKIKNELHEIMKKQNEKIEFNNYKEMLLGSYGETLFKLFFKGYNEKLFGLDDLSEISYGKFELIRNVRLGDKKGYNDEFKYPVGGVGIQGLINELSKDVVCYKNYQAVKIDLKKKEVYFDNVEKVKYDVLVSTLPLNKLVEMCTGISKTVKEKAKTLKASKGYIINLGIKAKSWHYGKTWIYYGDKDLPFYRIGFYSNVDKELAPEGYHSIYVECNTNPISKFSEVIQALIKEGIIQSKSDIEVVKYDFLDENYCFVNPHTEYIKNQLEKKDVYSIGRYGSWHWSSMHRDMAQAVELAQKLKDKN